MAKPMILTICHLYPDLMDTYGDRGNIVALLKRCEWRSIHTNLMSYTIGDNKLPQADIYFFGGGQDQAQGIVGHDLQKKAVALKKNIDNGAVLLSICGGYQLLQNYFQTSAGKKILGIGLFDAYTMASEMRMMNNLLIDVNSSISNQFTIGKSRLVGFENHSGKTYLGADTEPLGTVISGNGNNGEDKTEGAIYKNAFGCYLHGSLLPKNPHFADFLITKALERKYGKIKLEKLDDTLEWQAHNSAISAIR